MEEQLKQIQNRYDQLSQRLTDAAVIADTSTYTRLLKEHNALGKVVQRIEALQNVCKQKSEAENLSDSKNEDIALRQLAQEELADLTAKENALKTEIEELLLEGEGDNPRNVIVEIRAGTGGEEAALFAADLFRMYSKYSERQGWKLMLIDTNPTDLGGFKQVIFALEGDNVYKKMRFESGTHRVQRVPRTEASGRIHTSATTVAVLPEPNDVNIVIKPEDLEMEAHGSGGPGGQHVNKTASAVRIKHKPSGLVVDCQVERSQHRNRDLALKLLRTRLYERQQNEQQQQRTQLRRSQIGTGDRSEKIRTYNFPQNRITDHRINFSLHNLTEVLDGNLDEMISRLVQMDKEATLKSLATRIAAG